MHNLPQIVRRRCLLIILAVSLVTMPAALRLVAAEFELHTFDRQQLDNEYYSEGISVGEINGDGHVDIVYGPYWYEGPTFTAKHEIYPPVPQNREGYADNFFSWIYDFDADGASDVLVVGFPGTPAYVYENPGPASLSSHWQRHQVLDWVSNESPQFTNLVGDERPELVCTRDGMFGFATVPSSEPFGDWDFHPISEQVTAKKFGHGLGIGDLNGDGRLDLLHPKGWFEQPESGAESQRWQSHLVSFSPAYGGAEMYAYDVDGDGDQDVISSDAAHDFGLSWYEQIAVDGEPTFRRHEIMGDQKSDNRYGVLFSEPHSVALVDMDRDGLKDIITGKTYYSHHRKSPMWDAGAVVYRFRLVRTEAGVDWIPHLIDDEAGVGRQLTVADINDDQQLDVVCGGMKGAHVLVQQTTEVTPAKRRDTKPKLQVTQGVVPLGKEDQPLNLDFETGTLQDWTATGAAFAQQPIRGDTVTGRRGDMRSGHVGQYWIGTYEGHGDPATGTLTSVPFTVTHGYATFLVGGGNDAQTRVELIRSDTVQPFFRVAGKRHERLEQVVVDLRGHLGKEILIRLVDEGRGGWGHLNFDHFRFHETRPGRPTEQLTKLALDEYPHAGLAARQAAAQMTVPDGFQVLVGAAEPDVKQPIAMALDERGRVWVAEAYEYPTRAKGDRGRDRILIFSDTDGDGSLDQRKVFAEGLNLVSGLEVGFGGVWVGAAPYLLFIPDRDGNDVPDSEPQVLLDGWGFEDTHETLNTFNWGPDGWLYGCHGVFTHSAVGKPGTPPAQRHRINAGVWRYHPTRHEFEVYAEGTSNPWGLDFDDHGQMFITACVIPHLYHVIEGARYQRQAGQHFNPYTYRDIVTIADHLHYLGATPHSGNKKSDAAGGGHAHAGAMIYLGDRWPTAYRNQLVMNNIHGQRLNMDLLAPHDSGYVGSHGPDFLLTGDQASQILNLRYGPAGNAWMIDWYDMQACHHRDADIHDRSNGRIYKICYGDVTAAGPTFELATAADLDLAELVLHPNDWYVRHGRRILQERAATGIIDPDARDRLVEIAREHDDDTRVLRAIWALHVTGGIPADLADQLLRHSSEYVRGWSIQLAAENQAIPAATIESWNELAATDPSPVVRLYLAAAAQRIPVSDRWELLTALSQHAEDADDHNLPLMYWYAAEPLADIDANRSLAFAISAGESIPLLRDFMLRRIGSGDADSSINLLVNGLAKADDDDARLAFLAALDAALKGIRSTAPPAGWAAVSNQLAGSQIAEIKLQATALGVKFGDQQSIDVMRHILADRKSALPARQTALAALLAREVPGLAPLLHELAGEPTQLREAAIQGLAQYDHPATAKVLISNYPQLSSSEKRTTLATLCARVPYATTLLQAVDQNQIASTDLTADLVRQIQYLGDPSLHELLESVWGNVREASADKAKQIEHYKQLVTKRSGVQPDAALGRSVFAKTCQNCHQLYGVGFNIGPDLTGSNRANLDYLLTNIVDPSAVMAKEYQPTIVLTTGGRVIVGLLTGEDDQAVTLQTTEALVTIPVDEIDQRTSSDQSMMPDDQLRQFSDHEVRSLVAYLQGKRQVPLLATPENASGLLRREGLTGWIGDESLWTREQDEIVGRTDGLKHNEWLVSDFVVDDFHLKLDVKLVDNQGNSGIQFRSRANDGVVSGYQADVGPGWWGKLYEEHGRKLLWSESGEQYVRSGDWNRYEIRAVGSRIETYVNGHRCVDLDDPDGAERGVIAFQLHSGGPTEVRFRNLELEVLAAGASATADTSEEAAAAVPDE